MKEDVLIEKPDIARPRHREPVIIFEHIPKTAGRTMHTILWRVFFGQKVFLTTIPGQHRERIEELNRQLEDPDRRIRAIVSHAGFGLHELLPDTFDYRHFTFLRDPVDRVVSHYYYEIQQNHIDASVTLETFVREDLSRSCNVQTALLGGLELKRSVEGLTLTRDLYTDALLERAKANLRLHAAVGLTERFDESLLLLRHVFQWKWPRMLYVRKNVGHLRRTRPAMPESSLRLIRRYNELDLALYRYAQDLFEQQVAQHLPHRTRQLDTFRRLNAVYGKVFPWTYPVVRAAVHAARKLRKPGLARHRYQNHNDPGP